MADTNDTRTASAPVKIGWAARDITPDEPVGIPGQFYLRVSGGTLDPVTVTALVIENGLDSVIFLSADLVVIRNFLIDKIRENAAGACPELPVQKILLNATHTHAGPDYYVNTRTTDPGSSTATTCSYPCDLSIVSAEKMRDFIARRAADAIVEAWKNRAPGGIAWGYGFATVGHSRRVIYSDDVSQRANALKRSGLTVNGHGVMYGNTNDDKFSHYEAGNDSFINLLYTFDARGKLTGAIVNVPCPSQNHEQIWNLSASFWNEVRTMLKARYGNIHLLPQAAAGGDLAPRQLHYRDAELRRYRLKFGPLMDQWAKEGAEAFPAFCMPTPAVKDEVVKQFALEMARRHDIAERIVNAFDEVLAWAKKDIRTDLELRHVVTTLELPKRFITREEYEHEREELAELEKESFTTGGDPDLDLYHNSMLAAKRNRCSGVIRHYEQQNAAPTIPMELHVVRIGDIAFAGNRFELFIDYMHRMQARSPFEQTFVVQLAATPGTEGGTYLATERAAANKGYSASLYCNQVSPEGGQKLVDETVRILKEIR